MYSFSFLLLLIKFALASEFNWLISYLDFTSCTSWASLTPLALSRTFNSYFASSVSTLLPSTITSRQFDLGITSSSATWKHNYYHWNLMFVRTVFEYKISTFSLIYLLYKLLILPACMEWPEKYSTVSYQTQTTPCHMSRSCCTYRIYLAEVWHWQLPAFLVFYDLEIKVYF